MCKHRTGETSESWSFLSLDLKKWWRSFWFCLFAFLFACLPCCLVACLLAWLDGRSVGWSPFRAASCKLRHKINARGEGSQVCHHQSQPHSEQVAPIARKPLPQVTLVVKRCSECLWLDLPRPRSIQMDLCQHFAKHQTPCCRHKDLRYQIATTPEVMVKGCHWSGA